jgi:uncharacterized protein (TIGR03435 family)
VQFLSMYSGVFPHPVIDRTGLKKSYDFTLKLAYGQLRTQDDYIRVWTDAFKQQLGLVVHARGRIAARHCRRYGGPDPRLRTRWTLQR